MKKLLLVLALLLVGCTSEQSRVRVDGRLELKGHTCSYPVTTFEYDNCEYIAVGAGEGLAIAHKGNCKYCQKRANHE